MVNKFRMKQIGLGYSNIFFNKMCCLIYSTNNNECLCCAWLLGKVEGNTDRMVGRFGGQLLVMSHDHIHCIKNKKD